MTKVVSEKLFKHKMFWDLISSRLKNDKLSLREAAKDIGISAATLYRTKNHVPDIETAGRITQWLGLTMDVFLNGNGEAE